ncbi:hypothetical protein GCM10010129_84170 [Streptomyces fumigatiscleroticus]|nr:hypothetical protein GCM10010129_84170 [Streptomyces fumigatiscleroticus]
MSILEAINRGVHVEIKILISEIPNLSDQFGNLFSLLNSVAV